MLQQMFSRFDALASDICREVAEVMREQEGQGATCILLAAALSIVGAFAVKDPLKPEAIGVVSALRRCRRLLSCRS